MFERIISFSVHNKFIIAVFTVALIGGGFYAMNQIPVDAVPDITNNQVQVVTTSPSLSAEEVERFITYPVEIAMANLPGVEELRSVSRYGLSVVTVVFDDDVPVSDARQFVGEQINVAAEEIPEGLGRPSLMPITTGLGEIYQYVLEVDKAHEHKYDAMELRTIQDWIVKRQLAGIEGIVEVSSFGGFLRQFQVTVDPARLRSFGLTIPDILLALEQNNQNTGGSYLERGPDAVYIRAEGIVRNIEDIGNIVVRQTGTPVRLREVATVEDGYAPRYGAMTRNGIGEAVGGITLMLRDANSSKTLDNIHRRVAEVQSSLPEGVRIVPYLDRSDLVERTTSTIKTNLLEGGIIVVFVLVLLLGNLRAGFIVASVIPLSLMFAFVMMWIFGISANLMSLGALDFGIVVDGAVIIVEGILHVLVVAHAGKTLTRREMDDVVVSSSSSIYKSAAFGVLIIVVVFIPVMTLTGIEGKMFRPMAQTVSFAVLGALILSVTYVPMLSAVMLSRRVNAKENISARIIRSLQSVYEPALRLALAHPSRTLAIAGVLFVASILVFARLGGVFIPQLEEGDIAMQMTLPPGSSLQESIRSSTQAERILLENFPEVRQVVSKIGTAEIPTDPMSVELADIMIVMKEKKEWTTAGTREELVAMMEEKLSAIVGVAFQFTQPIQLRFNELMTGAKTDVAVKLYGEDLNVLHEKAVTAADLIAGIPGAADIAVEQTEGLPQLLVTYDRARLAQYGVSVGDLNSVIRTAFAGERVGVVFEEERKFDLVVRLSEKHRSEFDLGKLFVNASDGRLVPVRELANVKESVGPSQISHDNARRRIIVGINVRGRDVESVVNDVQEKLRSSLDLPPGYYITYGGDFENMKKAEQRLVIAVPVALSLILVLLYFAFGSLRHALLIFAAVPLSAIGGVFALWVRGMPFSISAGVGFIALFGVAVLNGIVLISYFNDLRKETKLDLREIVIRGGLVRLRPVVMTASVAALGFLPMALSQTAGAEVQRPLATVVIGGLISATLLTLVVLPVLYRLVETWAYGRNVKLRPGHALTIAALLLSGVAANAQGQPQVLTEAEAIQMALRQSPRVKIAELDVEQQRVLAKSGPRLPMANVGFQYGQQNSDARDPFMEVSQSFGSIPSHFRQARVNRQRVNVAEEQGSLTERELVRDVRSAWHRWLYLRQVVSELNLQLSVYADFEEKTDLQYQLGERSLLERKIVESSLYRLRNDYEIQSGNLEQATNDLMFLLATDELVLPAEDTLVTLVALVDTAVLDHPAVRVLRKQQEMSAAEVGYEKALFFPEIRVGYFRQNITETDIRFRGLQGFALEVAVPLWFRPRQSEIQRARIGVMKAEQQLELGMRSLRHARTEAAADARKYQRILDYFRARGFDQAEAIRQTADIQLQAGEIDFFQYLQSLERYTQLRLQFLEAVSNYNQSIIQLEYLRSE